MAFQYGLTEVRASSYNNAEGGPATDLGPQLSALLQGPLDIGGHQSWHDRGRHFLSPRDRGACEKVLQLYAPRDG